MTWTIWIIVGTLLGLFARPLLIPAAILLVLDSHVGGGEAKMKGATMRYALMLGLVALICGCGPSEPSNKEVARGMEHSLTEYGIPSSRVTSRATKLGNGRWAVETKVRRYDGATRTVNSTAVMDKNGDLHYYTD